MKDDPVMAYHDELKVALSAVEKAARLCQSVRNALSDIPSIQKEDRSPVTLADFGSQAVIGMELHKAFPDIPVVGEEASENLKNHRTLSQKVLELVNHENGSLTLPQVLEAIDIGAREPDFNDRFWVLDPIDGTKGFLRGNQYAVALALIENGSVVLGILGCPNLPMTAQDNQSDKGCMLYAIQGEGAWMKNLNDGTDESHIFVDNIKDGGSARFCESFERAHASHDVHQRISSVLGITHPPLRLDSQVKYAAIARGDASIYFRLPRQKDYLEKIWDHAAGTIIVEEAGGKVTDFYGQPIDFSTGKKLQSNKGVLATNGHLHQVVLEAISHVMQGGVKD